MSEIVKGLFLNHNYKVILINEKNKIIILDKIRKIFELEKSNLIERYRQGFLLISFESDIIEINNILDYLYRTILNEVFYKTNLNETLTKAKKDVFIKYNKTKTILPMINKLFDNIISSLAFLNYNKSEDYLIKLEKPTINMILNIPSNVKLVIFDKTPEDEIKTALNTKRIPYLITNKTLTENKIYYIDLINQQIQTSYPIYNKTNEIHKKKDINLGFSINEIKSSQKVIEIVLVEPEKSYLLSGGILDYNQRLLFYDKLFEKYPNQQIIISLPKLETLFKYHNLNKDYLLDEETFSRYFYLYDLEIKCIFTNKHSNISICLPPVVDDNEFTKVKLQISNLLMNKYNKRVKLGLNLTTETSFEYLNYYKKYDFSIVNIDTLIKESEILKSMSEKELTQQLSFLNQRLKIRNKPLYIAGYQLNNFKFYQSLIKKGFKNFIINETHFDSYNNYKLNKES